jgi:hypothetical protein
MLKQYAHTELVQNSKGQLVPTKEALSSQRREGESELDFYERRYQERVNYDFLI